MSTCNLYKNINEILLIVLFCKKCFPPGASLILMTLLQSQITCSAATPSWWLSCQIAQLQNFLRQQVAAFTCDRTPQTQTVDEQHSLRNVGVMVTCRGRDLQRHGSNKAGCSTACSLCLKHVNAETKSLDIYT